MFDVMCQIEYQILTPPTSHTLFQSLQKTAENTHISDMDMDMILNYVKRFKEKMKKLIREGYILYLPLFPQF